MRCRELQDIDEAGSETLNPLEDPIFYVLLIVGTPVLVMFGAAQVCVCSGCVCVCSGCVCEQRLCV